MFMKIHPAGGLTDWFYVGCLEILSIFLFFSVREGREETRGSCHGGKCE